jgi:hypothetical protein
LGAPRTTLFPEQSHAAGRRGGTPLEEPAMPIVISKTPPQSAASDTLTAELQAYNSAFLELELPWQWDVETFRRLRSIAADADCVSAYVERDQAHLLRVYDKSFLRDLILSTKARHHGQTAA